MFENKLSKEEQNALKMVVEDAVKHISTPLTVYLKLSLPTDQAAAHRVINAFTEGVVKLGAVRHYCCSLPSTDTAVNVWPIFFFDQEGEGEAGNNRDFMLRIMEIFSKALDKENLDYRNWDRMVPLMASVSDDPEVILSSIYSVAATGIAEVEKELVSALNEFPNKYTRITVVSIRTSFQIPLMQLAQFYIILNRANRGVKFVVIPGNDYRFNVIVFSSDENLQLAQDFVTWSWPNFVEKTSDLPDYPVDEVDGFITHDLDEVTGGELRHLCKRHQLKVILRTCKLLTKQD